MLADCLSHLVTLRQRLVENDFELENVRQETREYGRISERQSVLCPRERRERESYLSASGEVKSTMMQSEASSKIVSLFNELNK